MTIAQYEKDKNKNQTNKQQTKKTQAVQDAFEEKTRVRAHAKPLWEMCNVLYGKGNFRIFFFKLRVCIITQSLKKIILAIVR